MAQILRLDNTDKRITYDNNWKVISNSGGAQNGSYSLATAPAAQFFFLFRGIVHTSWTSLLTPHPHGL